LLGVNQTKKKQIKEKKLTILKGKDFIQSCGEAWQCILCKKVLSNRLKATNHIEDDHPSALIVTNNEPDVSDPPNNWMCNICKLRSSSKEKAVLHMQKTHTITRKRAIETSIIKIKI
jgi:hypothetical protein